jgi:hypothetical protein
MRAAVIIVMHKQEVSYKDALVNPDALRDRLGQVLMASSIQCKIKSNKPADFCGIFPYHISDDVLHRASNKVLRR